MKFVVDLDIDAAWLASDDLEHVAVLITAGGGPMPEVPLAPVDGVIDEIWDLPERCDCKASHVCDADPISLAKRGFFVYDWSDVREPTGHYQLLAEPSAPISLSELPDSVRSQVVRLRGVSFGERKLDVRA